MKNKKEYFFLTTIEPADRTMNLKMWSSDKWLLFVFSAVILSSILYAIYGNYVFSTPGPRSLCTMRQLFGLYCAGCGGTHALVSFYTGHLVDSFRYHPLVITALIPAYTYCFWNLIHFLSKGRIIGVRFHLWYLLFYIPVILGHWIYINYMVLAKGIYLIP